MATFGFIAPSMTFFLGIFAKGTATLQKINTEKIKKFQELLLNSPVAVDGDADDKIKEKAINLRLYKKAKRLAIIEANLAKPGRQVIRIFLSLLCSCILLSTYHILRSNYFNQIDHFKTKGSVLIISVIFFSYSLFAIGQVFFLMVKLKKQEQIDEENRLKELGTKLEVAN